MEKLKQISSYIYNRYQITFGREIDEMKLHKLLYFAQRESIIQKGHVMFDEEFQAWQYGPVMAPVREYYREKQLNDLPDESFVAYYGNIMDKVFEQFAAKDSLSLSHLTHEEFSWKEARKGLSWNEKSTRTISNDLIKKDAAKILLRHAYLERIKKC